MAVEVGQGEQEKAFIKHVFLSKTLLLLIMFVQYLSKTNGIGSLLLQIQATKSLLNLLV